MNIGVQIIVKGRVQGVSYRAYILNHALRLNLRGFVRNLSNGDVEIIALGDGQALDILLKNCQIDPKMAEVTDVIVNQQTFEEIHINFEIR